MRGLLVAVLLTVGLPGQEALKIGDGVSAPVPMYKVEPAYSEEAEEARVEGTLLFAIVVTEQGSVEQIRVVGNNLRKKGLAEALESDYGLARKGEEALEKWRFKPGMKDGKPVRVKANVEMNFRLAKK